MDIFWYLPYPLKLKLNEGDYFMWLLMECYKTVSKDMANSSETNGKDQAVWAYTVLRSHFMSMTEDPWLLKVKKIICFCAGKGEFAQ